MFKLDDGRQAIIQLDQATIKSRDRTHADIREILATIRVVLDVRDITPANHEAALDIAERYGYSFYDSMILAAALDAGCRRIYTEDLHAGQHIKDKLMIVNPF